MVQARTTDPDKGMLLERELDGKVLRTAQVREILGWLSFESTRLGFAKWAYGKVSDPEQYRTLEDVFVFSSSKEEFREAINR